eukprot:m.551787 g.551787  ORF g.551787 m.551787 type:complete len:184 (+) comp22165_c0_seq56:1061-1612(+)
MSTNWCVRRALLQWGYLTTIRGNSYQRSWTLKLECSVIAVKYTQWKSVQVTCKFVEISDRLPYDAFAAGGVGLKTSLFATASELMTVPYLQQLHTGAPPVNAGLAHPSIAPYGAFPTRDAGKKVLISIQNEREWQRLCDDALGVKGLRDDSRFKTPDLRVGCTAEYLLLTQLTIFTDFWNDTF